MMTSLKRSQLLIFALIAACGDGGTGPDDTSVSIAVQSGDAQFGSPSTTLLDPLQVVVIDPVSKDPAEGITVSWTVTSGNGALISPVTSETDENGVATTMLRLGSTLGEYVVEARAGRLIGQPAQFRARAVQTPAITSAPASVNGGDTITIAGSNFSPQSDDNIVLFGGFRAKVVSATTTQLRVVVPVCVSSRLVPLTASLGAVASSPVTIDVRASEVSTLQMARGEVKTFTDPGELGCLRLPSISGYTVLLVPQNYSDVASTSATFRLAGLSGGSGGPIANVEARLVRGTTDIGSTFEANLRVREKAMLADITGANARPQPQHSSVAACPAPQVGSRCAFQVLNKDDRFVTVTAELKAISDRALIYGDINSPTNGLTTENYQTLGRTFDDPIYNAVTAAFGTPSDLDTNSKVIVLLTPIVNELTPRGSSGFIAGFFYGCDLVARTVCSGSNGGEIFYTLTADPTAQFGDTRTVTSVLRSLPPVLGHEFQHMIHFGVRKSTDALWLSEGLAHHAEDIVADVYQARGETTTATNFRAQNYARATRYLRDPSFTSLIAENGSGSLEMRGAAWLFVKYLVGQQGVAVLRSITNSTESSVTNVVKQTGKPWSTLMANWGVALYADNAPELTGVTVRPEYTFPNINLRAELTELSSYPLRPAVQTYNDFVITESLPASSQTYVTVQGNGATSPFSLNLTGQFGGSLPTSAAPQLSILRIQ